MCQPLSWIRAELVLGDFDNPTAQEGTSMQYSWQSHAEGDYIRALHQTHFGRLGMHAMTGSCALLSLNVALGQEVQDPGAGSHGAKGVHEGVLLLHLMPPMQCLSRTLTMYPWASIRFQSGSVEMPSVTLL